jgi:hypothetical protein
MTARGIKINSSDASPSYAGMSGVSFNQSTEDISVLGWMVIKGTKSGGGAAGHIFAYLSELVNFEFVIIRAMDADVGTPWTEILRYSTTAAPGVGVDVGSTGDIISTDENCFYAWTWKASNGTLNYYWAKDGAAINNATAAVGAGAKTATLDTFRFGSNNAGGSNIEITNGMIFKRELTSAQVDAQRKSAEVIDSTSIFGHYKMMNGTDLTNYSAGAGPTLTAFGTLADGTMDPLDLRPPLTTKGRRMFLRF